MKNQLVMLQLRLLQVNRKSVRHQRLRVSILYIMKVHGTSIPMVVSLVRAVTMMKVNILVQVIEMNM